MTNYLFHSNRINAFEKDKFSARFYIRDETGFASNLMKKRSERMIFLGIYFCTVCDGIARRLSLYKYIYERFRVCRAFPFPPLATCTWRFAESWA